MRLFYYFDFERSYNELKSKSAFCLTKIKTLMKTKQNRKWKNPHTVYIRNSYNKRKLKIKL